MTETKKREPEKTNQEEATETKETNKEEIKEIESRPKSLKRKEMTGGGGTNQYMIPLSIIVAGIFVAAAVYFSGGGGNSENVGNTVPPQPTQPQGGPVDIADVDLEGEPFIGDPNAPVTLAYWLDFQCPFCQRFEQNTLPTLISDYVDKGQLRVVFKDFQFLGSDSQDAGIVAKAVWDLYPDRYFKWHEAMYNMQDGENSGFGDMESILQLIRDELPDIDADKVAQRVEEKRSEYQSEQDADKAEGGRFNITGTPGFVIGEQNISGAQPTSVFTQAIDSELNK